MSAHSHSHARKILLITSIPLLVFGAVGYGTYRFIKLSHERNELRGDVARLRTSIEELEGHLSLTEYERDRLSFVLDETQERATELEEATETLEGKVGTFEKLQQLDPELLKKYSKVYFLNEHFVPPSLATVNAVYVNGEGRAMQVDERVWPYLERLLADSTNEGLGLLVTSAYRSFGTQAALKAGYRVTYGAGTANQFSADQGYSEHQLGTTLDFTTKKTRTLSGTFDQTPEYTWLTKHAHEYGFVLSYPKGNKYYIYEPWHWRFVGIALATKLYEDKKHLYDVDQRDIDEYLITIFD